MSNPTATAHLLDMKVPPILRIPPEIVLQIFKLADKRAQRSLANTCSFLSLIGSPVIFRTLRFQISYQGDSAEDERNKTDLRALAASRRAGDVRTLLLYDYSPLFSELVSFYLPLFINLHSMITPESSPKIVTNAFLHPSLESLHCDLFDDFLEIWWNLNNPRPLRRRDNTLLLRPLLISTVGPYSSDRSWTGSNPRSGLTSKTRDLDWFFGSTTAANVAFGSIQLLGDASVPIPPSGHLSNFKLPSLEEFGILASRTPTLAFLESLGTVATVQSPSSYLLLVFGSRHPLLSSLGTLGKIAPFQELSGVSGWEQLGMVKVSIQFDRDWRVDTLKIGLEEGSFTSSFLTSMGSSLRNLTTLVLDMNPDGVSQTEAGWPVEWSTVVESFKTFQSLTFLTVPPSLTPEATYTNDIACSDASFARLSSSHPLLHQQTLDVGGWWLAWKRLGWRLNLSRLRRLGSSLPEGCVVEWGGPSVFWEGKVVAVEGGRKAFIGQLTAGDLSADADGDPEDRETVQEDCSRRANGWRCFACGGVGQEKDLFESARMCGEEEFERALNDEWKTRWSEDDVKAELALKSSTT